MRPNQPLQRAGSAAPASHAIRPAAERQVVRRLIRLTLLAAHLMLVGTSCTRTADNTEQVLEPQPTQDHQVYAAILRDPRAWEWKRTDLEQRNWVVEQSTSPYFLPESQQLIRWDEWFEGFLRGKFPSADIATIRAFRDAQLREPVALDEVFKSDAAVRLVTADTINSWKAGVPGMIWGSFWEAFPESDGLWTFSNIAYGPGGSEALVWFQVGAGGHAGVMQLALLKRQPDGWVVAELLPMGAA